MVELVTSASPNLFNVTAATHPGLTGPTGAEKISVPYISLAAGEAPGDTVKKF